MSIDLEVIGTASLSWLPPTWNNHKHLAALALQAEQNNFTGLLAFYDHMVLDPWVVAGLLLQQTSTLVPIVAIQPYSTPPFTAAKTISSLTSLYRRRIDLNVITGAAPEELDQVGNVLDHDGRYTRAAEYLALLRQFLSSDEPVTWNSNHYEYRDLKINANLPEHIRPRIFIAGSSQANMRLAEQVGDVAITHPEPVNLFADTFADRLNHPTLEIGIRIGVVGRRTSDEAWTEACNNHSIDRSLRLKTLLKRESESDWNRRMARLASEADVHDGIYWTGTYSAGKSGAPLLVGSYGEVAEYLDRYIDLGVTKLLLTRVDTEDDFRHANEILSRVSHLQ